MTRLLLCTDLDRTLIPNGREPESPDARERFRRFVARTGITLAYVSGRHRALVEQAIDQHGLPAPDYIVGDVGATIYSVADGAWRPVHAWEDEIGRDWAGAGHAQLRGLFAACTELRLQEDEKQHPFKLSYYAPIDTDHEALKTRMRTLLAPGRIRANLLWSVDEAAEVGLLDVLPENASKFHAVDFLMRMTGHDETATVFAGDSGNDLEVLVSPIPSVLVANGHAEVRATAMRLAAEGGTADRLYCARGDWCGMNGNYSAGILEGVAHFRPDLPACESL